MRRHADPRLEERANAALSDPASARALTTWALEIAGVPVVPREIRWRADDVRGQDAPAMVLEATLPGFWPPETEDDLARVELSVDGAGYEEFRGRVRVVDPTDDGDTAVEAYTPGEWLGRQEIGRELAWNGHGPRGAMWEAVRAAPYERIDLSGVPRTPKLDREASEAFAAQAKRSELLDDVRTRGRAVFFDDPDGTGRGLALSALSAGASLAPEFAYVVGRHVRAKGGFKATPARDGRYSEVVVYAQGAEGEREPVRRFAVDNRAGGKRIRVPEGVVFPIEAADRGPEALADALRQGFEAARMLEGGLFDFEISQGLILDPRIVRGSVGTVEETRTEGFGAERSWRDVTRRYLCVVAGYSRDPISGVPTMVGSALKVSESAEEAPPWAA